MANEGFGWDPLLKMFTGRGDNPIYKRLLALKVFFFILIWPTKTGGVYIFLYIHNGIWMSTVVVFKTPVLNPSS